MYHQLCFCSKLDKTNVPFLRGLASTAIHEPVLKEGLPQSTATGVPHLTYGSGWGLLAVEC